MFKNRIQHFMDAILPHVAEYIKEHMVIEVERKGDTIYWTTWFAGSVISKEEVYIGPLEDIEPPPWPFAEPAVDKPEE
jgi:hypothetical protein